MTTESFQPVIKMAVINAEKKPLFLNLSQWLLKSGQAAMTFEDYSAGNKQYRSEKKAKPTHRTIQRLP